MANGLSTKDYYYDLPEELIAQTPAEVRDASRLLVLHREDGTLEHKIFRDVIDYLSPGDALVINDSRVIPARIYGVKEGTDTAVEFVLLRQRSLDEWEALVRPGKRLKEGACVLFGEGKVRAEVLGIVEDGNRIVRFTYDRTQYSGVYDMLHDLGTMPLPPYIHGYEGDRERYQTVYSREEGSAAAPTAGLHFTKELLAKIREKGIEIIPVMLHVGLGTFRPVKVDDVREHVMHKEYIEVTEEAAERINAVRANGGRIVCVGTTSTRTVESAADDNGIVRPFRGDTGIFIYPGYRFKVTDALITNFHLPESTLLMLVSALAGRETILAAYREAVEHRYRFFSFGDAMLIL